MRHLGFLALAFTAFLVACGDDASSSPVDDPVSSSIEISSSDEATPESSSSSSVILSGDSHEESSPSSSSSSSSALSSSSAEPALSSAEGVENLSSSSAKSSADIAFGTLTDERDGKTYKTVVIGKQTWMAENLNYESRYSYCYEDKTENCAKYGRLYTWSGAMEACPAGWGLPSLEEFQILLAAVGGQAIAGKVLKSTEGWRDGGNGTDDYGFSALPAGYRYDDTTFLYQGEYGQFWSTSGSTWIYQLEVTFDSDSAYIFSLYREFGFSVRCLKSAGAAHETPAVPCKTDSTDTCEYGSVKDDRDGQIYKTVKIGDQWWMAQNLNYEMENSFCADDSSCAKYGRLYTWGAVMDSAAQWSEGGKGCGVNSDCSPSFPVRGVCPSGWHVPSRDEWINLRAAIIEYGPDAKALKSTDGWIGGWVNMGGGVVAYDSLGVNGKGTDSFGFTALPAGYWDGSAFRDDGLATYFWSSSEKEYEKTVHARYLTVVMNNSMMEGLSKSKGLSLRCVKDAD